MGALRGHGTAFHGDGLRTYCPEGDPTGGSHAEAYSNVCATSDSGVSPASGSRGSSPDEGLGFERRYGDSMVESWASSPAARATMQGNRGRDTAPELALRRAVHARGLRFFVGRRPIRSLRRTADMLFPRLKLAVFLDGCFWHGCPEHHVQAKANADFWAQKVKQNRERDGETDRLLTEAGWTVLRIWEHVPAEDGADLVEEAVRRLDGRHLG